MQSLIASLALRVAILLSIHAAFLTPSAAAQDSLVLRGAKAPTAQREHRFVRVAMYAPVHLEGRVRFSGQDGSSSLGLGPGRGVGMRMELAFRRVLSLGVVAEWTRILSDEAWDDREKPEDDMFALAPWVLVGHTFHGVAGGLTLGVSIQAGPTRWLSDEETRRGVDFGTSAVVRLFTGPGFAVFAEAGVRHRRFTLDDGSARFTQLAVQGGMLFGY